jgi:hypothetical protein
LKDLADDMDELPELVVTELSQAEISELRREPDADVAFAVEATELIEGDNYIIEEIPA